jgi:curli biogenesis system outer membrane secretion channel CsgG
MKKNIYVLAVVALAFGGLSSLGCVESGIPGTARMIQMPPTSQSLLEVTARITPRSQKFKVAVLTFVDQTGKGNLVVDPIADMLTTELFAGGRFELYDRGDLVQEVAESASATEVTTDGEDKDSVKKTVIKTTSSTRQNKTALQKKKVQTMVDGILLGYITSFEINEPAAAPEPAKGKKGKKGKSEVAPVNNGPITGSLHCDFRIVNSWLTQQKVGQGQSLSELVVYSGSARIGFTTDAERTSVSLSREDIQAIAAQIKDKFTDFSRSKIGVTAIDGRVITLDVGKQDLVKQGFTGYIVQKDERTHVLKYLAEFTIINVFDTACTAYVVSADKFLQNLRLGSQAVIK